MKIHSSWLLILLTAMLQTACESDSSLHQGAREQSARCTSRPASAVATDQEISLQVGERESTTARIWESHKPCSPLGIVFVSGVNGGYEQPVDGIYERLAAKLAARGIHSIFVKYHRNYWDHGFLEASISDAVAAAGFLRGRGVRTMAIVGWSFGGAVITHAAPRIPEMKTVIGLAPQSRDAEPVSTFTHQSLLLFHSRMDDNVPYESGAPIILSEAPATIRKELISFDQGDHYFKGMAAEIDPIIEEWLGIELGF